MHAVEVDHLLVRYGSLVAVNGVSFVAEAGEVVALLGPNGAGKTTIVETLEGYRRPDDGSVRILGLDPSSRHSELTTRVGVVLQRGGIYPVMSPARAVHLFAAYYEDARDPEELIDLVGLRSVARTAYKRLSGGRAATPRSRPGAGGKAACRSFSTNRRPESTRPVASRSAM